MPHLSPMNWLISLLSFWLIIMSISSISWWSQSPNWPSINSSNNMNKSSKWHWL